MSSFYSNLAQEDTKNTKKIKKQTNKQMRVKNAIMLKKCPKMPKKNLKNAQKAQF
jgi:hypothetical protein